ncbi:conserved protein [Tepidicaulis marinus]|uniref:Conserved protein n=1 Tax=Tepidicaulis marinus TaxID=1333998 RepID=A0A081BF43_9HYPH|nr:hypothetical protein [Tepidicaulis marinus]GAK46661.1 conserved protein [Tepidicaulis marinus]
MKGLITTMLMAFLVAGCEHLDDRQGIGSDTNELKKSDCACDLIYDADGLDQWTS